MSRTKGAKNKPKPTASAARLPYPADIYNRFGIDALQWKVLVEAVLPDAPTADSVIRVLSYCKTCADAQMMKMGITRGHLIMDEPEANTEEARDGEPPPRFSEPSPRVRDPGPTDPGPQPRTISGKGESCETWAEKYIDCLRTSQTVSQFRQWNSLNAEPLGLLTKRKPSVAAAVRKASEDVLQALTDEEDARVARQAKADSITQAMVV